MFEMIMEALAEMLGLETQPKNQPPPRRRQPAQPRSQPQPVQDDRGEPEQRQVTLEELLREVAGMEQPAPPPTKQSGRSFSSGRRERKERGGTARRGGAREAAPRVVSAVAPEAVSVVPPASPVREASPVVAPRSAVSEGAEYAARLRGNPSAAREAFVYAEIFGRPLGERF